MQLVFICGFRNSTRANKIAPTCLHLPHKDTLQCFSATGNKALSIMTPSADKTITSLFIIYSYMCVQFNFCGISERVSVQL